MQRQQTALFFGSFNPIHIGHLIVANVMMNEVGFDEVWFVVSPQSPFKHSVDLMSEEHRLAMVRLATADNERFRVCDVEMRLPRPNYTVTTVEALHDQYPERQFAIVMGSDNLEGLTRWYKYEHLLEMCPVYVYPRPGSEHCEMSSHERVTMIDVPMMEISSTDIRRRIMNGSSVRYMTPDCVADYMQQHRCLQSIGL
ncbi:MAG: nicotinate-nucleotide adenylyltransferase [Bacteroidales bacterium]|nr:nicotinate-nucleotide adenylyltransferase [Bacteroidales bacterium]